jgi:hypothetical protein
MQKYSIVLSKNNHVINLLINEQHIVNIYNGIQVSLNIISDRLCSINEKNMTKLIDPNYIDRFKNKQKLVVI